MLKSVDPLYRNVLHAAATEQKSKCIWWLLHNVERIDDLQIAMNLVGHTPLEALQAKLEQYRDETPPFTGFSANAVLSLSALQHNFNQLDIIELRRMRFGCTCGRESFLNQAP